MASTTPTGRANARPMTGSTLLGAIWVRRTLRKTEHMEGPPHPNPLPASGERGALPSNGLESVKKDQQVAGT